MIRREVLIGALSMVTLGLATPGLSNAAQPDTVWREHERWVRSVLQQMQGIRKGMTRGDMLKVFTEEGGLSTGLQRTYVSKECPYFKADFSFEAVGRPDRNADGGVTLQEDNRDIIVGMSRPYLEFSIED